jgi:hypothetical protein
MSLSNVSDFANAMVGTKDRPCFGLLLAEVLIPCLHQIIQVFFNNGLNIVKLPNIKTVIGGNFQGIQPELCLGRPSLYMDVQPLHGCEGVRGLRY